MSESKDRVTIFTDGSCLGNPGPGGWAAILQYKQKEKTLQGHSDMTTNNRMEMSAAIGALKHLKHKSHVDLYTDSQYLRQGVCDWMPKWKVNQWRTAARKPVKNKDLWEALDQLVTQHDITWHWVKGHAGHPENERVDLLARAAIPNQASS